MKILIWGTGENTRNYLNTGEIKPEELIGLIETNPAKAEFSEKIAETLWHKKIYRPDEISGLDYDYILVCIFPPTFVEEIANTCERLNILDHRIIFMRNIRGVAFPQADRFLFYNGEQDDEKVRHDFPVFAGQFLYQFPCENLVLSLRNNDDVLHDSALEKPGFEDYTFDYFRYRTFELAAREIKNRKVKGNVAEVGVFKGQFSRLINEIFPEKTLYLFDTFESFDRQEFCNDPSSAVSDEKFYEMFKDTSIEKVLGIMPYRERCVIRKGFFPETAAGLEDETFAFVSIDVDLESPIYNSLEFFYPSLQKGGILFIHDYTCHSLSGVRKAVSRYEKENGPLLKVPIADNGGTLIVLKPLENLWR